jgi:hypothetical protein
MPDFPSSEKRGRVTRTHHFVSVLSALEYHRSIADPLAAPAARLRLGPSQAAVKLGRARADTFLI